MFRHAVRAGLLGLLLGSTALAVEVPLPRLELLPWTLVKPEAPGLKPLPLPADEAVRDKSPAKRLLPFQWDPMPSDEERDEETPPQRLALDIRAA